MQPRTRYPRLALYFPNWTKTLALSRDSPAWNRDHDRAWARLLCLPQRMLRPLERALRIVALHKLGDSGAERDSVRSLVTVCGVQSPEQRLRIVNRCPRQDECELA